MKPVSFLLSLFSYRMPFLCKKPSVVARVLCATQCPPHDVFHFIDDYPCYYDACYFPQYHASIFAVCAWLSASLEAHSLNCCVHSRLLSHITVTTNGSSLCDQRPSHFHFFLDGVHFSMPIAYVQSSTFSFCRLHHFHDLLLSKLSCQTTSTQHDLWTLTGINVLVEEPTWLHRDRTSYVTSLSALTMSQLNDVVNSLRLTSPQRKSDLVNVVLTDFFEQRTCFWYIVINSSRPCAYSISQHFHDRYHNAVF